MLAPLYRGGLVAYVLSSCPPVSCFLEPLSYDAGTALNIGSTFGLVGDVYPSMF